MRLAIRQYDCSYVMTLHSSYTADSAASLLILQTANTSPAKLALKSKFFNTDFICVSSYTISGFLTCSHGRHVSLTVNR